MDIVFIIRFIILLPILGSHAVKVSKACFGVLGLPCTRHTLDCHDRQIAIQDAFHSNNNQCLVTGIPNCIPDVANLTYGRREEFHQTTTDELYRNCSFKNHCMFNAVKKGNTNLSTVKYLCIQNTTKMCEERGTFNESISLIWNKTSATNKDKTCSCRISSNPNHPTALFSLDMRPRKKCENLSIAAEGEIYKDCNKNVKYQLLTNSTWSIVLAQVDIFDVLWIHIQGPSEVYCTRTLITTTTTQSTTQDNQSPTPTADAVDDQGNVGAIAGGVTGVVVLCLIGAAVLIWFKFLRNKKEVKKQEGEIDNYVSAGSISSKAVQGNARDQRTGNNYDYATIKDGANPVGHARNDYDLAGKLRTAKEEIALTEDDYNHINHNPPQSAQSSGYDTAAWAAAAVKKLSTSHSVEDDYNHLGVGKPTVVSSDYDATVCEDDYNHLGVGKPTVVSSDYDTTVSALKAVENKNGEDDYDHFKRTEDRVIDSPYDTANHHENAK